MRAIGRRKATNENVDEVIKYNGLPQTIMGNHRHNELISFIIYLLHWSGLFFEVFFHVRFGTEYANPFTILFQTIKHSVFLVFQLMGFIIFCVFLAVIWFWSFGFLYDFYYLLFDLYHSQILRIFFISSLALMFLHTLLAYALYDKERRHSYSMGVPWIYAITGNDFFNSKLYIFTIQPLIAIGITALLYYQMGFSDAKYLMYMGFAYLFRNFIISANILSTKKEMRDMAIKGDYHNSGSDDEIEQQPAKKNQGGLSNQHSKKPKESSKFEDPYG